MIEPLLIISQAIPKVALAPIFLIALGSGIESRALISALICFFPFYANLTQGLTSVSPELLLQARLADKSRMQVLLFIRCIFAIPYFVTAARSAILLSVIGVVVGEFVGANNGLGYLILDSSARFNIDLMFACILALSIIGGSLYVCVSLLGKKMINMTRLGK